MNLPAWRWDIVRIITHLSNFVKHCSRRTVVHVRTLVVWSTSVESIAIVHVGSFLFSLQNRFWTWHSRILRNYFSTNTKSLQAKLLKCLKKAVNPFCAWLNNEIKREVQYGITVSEQRNWVAKLFSISIFDSVYTWKNARQLQILTVLLL